ncbi:MAG: serine--tRNA ligase [Patescibacteria group bacterium]|nr:serine--tRNA ligase [Patescibacteria group bacterium]
MLDINFIRENKEIVEKSAKDKGFRVDIDKLIKIDDRRRKLLTEIENLRTEQNKISKGIKGKPDKAQIEKSKKIKKEQEKLLPEIKKVEEDFNQLMLLVPNIPSKDTPVGPDENSNKEVKKWGNIPKFDFPIKDHLDLGIQNDLIDIERAVKLAGTRSYFLKNDLVLFENAVLRFALDTLKKEGFQIFNPPVLLNRQAFIGTGFFPTYSEDIYKVEGEEYYLAGTAEVPVASYYSNETLGEHELPKLMAGISSCFRKEVGTYGKDTRGVFRLHQFNKVEQVVISKPEEAEKYFNFILETAEKILKALEIPYRVMQLSTGEMGFPQYKKYDIECWVPSQKKYRETHSCSNDTDFQARRLNIKYRSENGEKEYVYTLNNTAIATPRILIPLLELNQQKDGSIKTPKVLQPYMNGQKEIRNQ